MPTQEEINASKEKAVAEYHARRDKEKRKNEELKAGVKYIHDRGLPIYTFSYGYTKCYHTVSMTWEIKNNQILFAFAFCSPKDDSEYSEKISKGLLGIRLQTKKHTILCESLKLTDSETALLGQSLLTVASLEGTGVPDCIKREAKCSSNNGWVTLNVVCPRKPLKRLPE